MIQMIISEGKMDNKLIQTTTLPDLYLCPDPWAEPNCGYLLEPHCSWWSFLYFAAYSALCKIAQYGWISEMTVWQKVSGSAATHFPLCGYLVPMAIPKCELVRLCIFSFSPLTYFHGIRQPATPIRELHEDERGRGSIQITAHSYQRR
jgi:hypothetical protein